MMDIYSTNLAGFGVKGGDIFPPTFSPATDTCQHSGYQYGYTSDYGSSLTTTTVRLSYQRPECHSSAAMQLPVNLSLRVHHTFGSLSFSDVIIRHPVPFVLILYPVGKPPASLTAARPPHNTSAELLHLHELL